MSSNDGGVGRCEDGFYVSLPGGVEMAPAHQHMVPHASTSAVLPPPAPPMIWSPQYIHHHQQQQQYNELLFNMQHAPFPAAAGPPETYTVLPVGHGNFLKVYHRAESNAPPGNANDALIYQQLQQQQQYQQQSPGFHATAQQQHQHQTQPMFNSYELFSSNTLMPTPENNALEPVAAADDVALAVHGVPQELPLQPALQLLDKSAEMQTPPTPNDSTTNMIINKLVNNWSPNLTGGTYAQFGAALCPVSAAAALVSTTPTEAQLPLQSTQLLAAINSTANMQDATSATFVSLPPAFLPQATQQAPPVTVTQTQLQEPQQQPEISVLPHGPEASSVNLKTNGTFKLPPVFCANAHGTSGNSHASPAEPGSKKRIVAEVKPMRMTYSDVLSKFNNQYSEVAQPAGGVKTSASRAAKQSSALSGQATTGERKAESKRAFDSIQRQCASDDGSLQTKTLKKSPTHENNKENMQHGNAAGVGKSNLNKRSAANAQSGQQRTTQKAANTRTGNIDANKKRQQKRTEADYTVDGSRNSSNNNSGGNGSSGSSNCKHTSNADKDFNGFYNVTAKSNENFERASKGAHNATANSYRRSAKASAGFAAGTGGSQNYSRTTQRSTTNGLSASSISSSYSYSSKRNRATNATASGNSHHNNSRNYELAEKLLRTWCEYAVKILSWLFYLVYDIVVLGCSMGYERLSHYCVCCMAYAKHLRQELRQNSNKPSIWLRNYARRFDARFRKQSRWAFWRRFYKKRQPEVSADFYKNGRLPQTGEEAMYSLLNCKGKDAYSILGVPSNSSQEQIRKHYKKIAVLVHPDKNKQAGAEEAFKVLQRAFELVGEPENRASYDRSLDEALHAEKAWTELHDLLSQLQTKITEAANTIRCSTCGLRHPRKLTDRPHYAARECASCKIRHSAREGDIWAETTLLGLRWKYLALMEGKVYDITEWANCQKGALSHLEPNSHMVQYRIVRGAQQQQQQQSHPQQTHNNQSHQQYHHPPGGNKFKRDMPHSEASLHEFLDNLYSGQHPNGPPNPAAFSGSTKKRTRRNQ